MARHTIFCDESRVTGCRYMLIGAMVVAPGTTQPFRDADAAFRAATRNNDAHFKWDKACSTKKLPDYLSFVELFFNHDLRFKCIVAEKSQINYAQYHRNDHELGFYKFYFLLLSRLVDFRFEYDVRIHRRTDQGGRGRLVDLQSATNNWCRRMCGRNIKPIQTLEPMDSRGHSELQLVDVLLGAIGYHWEHSHLKENASKSKVEICNAICKKLGKPSLAFHSDWREKKCNVWKWCPRNGAAP